MRTAIVTLALAATVGLAACGGGSRTSNPDDPNVLGGVFGEPRDGADRDRDGEGQRSVWVCHGNRNPRWLRVAAPAARAHERHGDRISTRERAEGESC